MPSVEIEVLKADMDLKTLEKIRAEIEYRKPQSINGRPLTVANRGREGFADELLTYLDAEIANIAKQP